MEDFRIDDIPAQVTQEVVWLKWLAPARPYVKKSPKFMAVPTVIAILLGAIFIVAGEWMLIIVISALVFGYYTWMTVPPEQVEYKLTSRGVRVGEKLYDWREFTRWWTETKWGSRLIMLEAPMQVAGRVALPVGESIDESVLESLLNKILIKEAPRDTIMDRTGKWVAEKFPLEGKS